MQPHQLKMLLLCNNLIHNFQDLVLQLGDSHLHYQLVKIIIICGVLFYITVLTDFSNRSVLIACDERLAEYQKFRTSFLNTKMISTLINMPMHLQVHV